MLVNEEVDGGIALIVKGAEEESSPRTNKNACERHFSGSQWIVALNASDNGFSAINRSVSTVSASVSHCLMSASRSSSLLRFLPMPSAVRQPVPCALAAPPVIQHQPVFPS